MRGATAMPKKYQLMVLLASWCALRFGELVELRRKDIDIKNGIIRVRRGATRAADVVKRRLVVELPKALRPPDVPSPHPNETGQRSPVREPYEHA
jgi:integrase